MVLQTAQRGGVFTNSVAGVSQNMQARCRAPRAGALVQSSFHSNGIHRLQRREAPSTSSMAAGPNSDNVCMSGLNGLSAGGVEGLDSGCFHVAAQQPVLYTVQESLNLLSLDNKSLLRGLLPDSFPARLAAEPVVEAWWCLGSHPFFEDRYSYWKYMQYHGVEYEILPLPTCEPNKSFNLIFQVAERLEAFKLNRRKEPIIAIGGGVCLDVAGLAANLHLSNGSAEILKMACIKDGELFELLEKHSAELIQTKFQSPHASTIMRRSIQGMLEELEYNLWEHILSRLVDYGHAFSPEIEMAALQGDEALLLHGEAVNIDMALTTQLAYQRGYISSEERRRVFGVMRQLGLAIWHEVCTIDVLMQGLEDTTRQRDGIQRVPFMKGIGEAMFVNDIVREEVELAAQYVSQLHAEQLAEAAHNGGYLANSITPLEPVPQSVKQFIREPAMAH
ncbi:hypothetical protein WJX79_005390 [Trebouxia sp. C0005]